MASFQDLKKAQDEWREHCRQIQNLTDTKSLVRETATQKEQRIRRLRRDYAAFCEYYFPHFLTLRDKVTGEAIRTIHNAPFHNAAAKLVKNTPNLKAVFKWPRGHAKSTHFDIFMPLWLMFQEKRLINFMVIVGKSEDSADRLLGDIQAELQYNKRIIADFGKQMSLGNWTEGEFTTKDGVYFLACGRGQSPRGLRKRESRPDYIVIDDLDDDELCRNERRVRELTGWVKEALFGALDVGRGRFLMVGNLISKTSVLANICATKGVHVSTVYAVDNEGNPVWKEKWTKEEPREYMEFVGYRAWNKEMMHNPIVEGTVFRQEWIKWAKRPAWKDFTEFVLYIDPSWKSKKTNDTKAAKLWAKRKTELWPPPCFRAQGIGSGTGALVLRPLRVEPGSRHCHTLCDGGLIHAGYDTRRLHGGGQSAWLPTPHHGRHAQEAGQVPAHRGHQSALGAWLRVLRPGTEGRPRHASRTGAAAGFREGYVRQRRRA